MLGVGLRVYPFAIKEDKMPKDKNNYIEKAQEDLAKGKITIEQYEEVVESKTIAKG